MSNQKTNWQWNRIDWLILLRSKNYIKFDKAFNVTRIALATLLSGVYIFILVFNLGYALDIKMVTLLSTGFLFLVLGNYLGQIRPTYFVGIRTPWTLNKQS